MSDEEFALIGGFKTEAAVRDAKEFGKMNKHQRKRLVEHFKK